MATGGIEDNPQECGSDAVGGRFGRKCEPCRHRDRSEVASLFCYTCKMYMCDDCCDVHKVHMKNVDGHEIVAAHEACVKAEFDMKGLDQCCEHKRVFMFHCEDHENLCCEICAFSNHRRCDNIQEIAKVAKNVKDDEREKIRASIITASDVIKKCEEDQLNNVSRVDEIVKQIDIYKEDLLKKIEEAKARIVSEMTDHNTQDNERLNTRRNAAENLKKELDTHLAMSDSVRENGTETEIFILNHILKRTHDKASQTLNTLLKNDYTVSPMTRVDKADSLEITVFHMKRLQHQQRAVRVANEATEAASSATSYQTGFLDCLREAVAYRVSDDACDPVVATIVSGHLRSVYAQKQNSSQAAKGRIEAEENRFPLIENQEP
ncbi:hypothetical protein MAR_013952 [Mya arenaria]|uniref:B box-type domain-containing protein n=1 Tax=Mya arenaria TaxID=6604 RepID=A0ABY7G1A8_MYAAR|nr:hypothetical protein MAR_013952 [Mya arenaria]